VTREHHVLRPLRWAEDVVNLAISLLLLGIAAVVLYRTTSDFVTSSHIFPAGVTTAINGVLFVIIVMEILTTVAAHFEGAGFQLKPFLVIGIISAVRHILTVGAQLSLAGEGTTSHLHNALLELGVNAGVVLALVLALVLVRRTETETSPPTGVVDEP
jgi:uncharacterized membrane protein (DUF373 family)